jgi:hypothetical protein
METVKRLLLNDNKFVVYATEWMLLYDKMNLYDRKVYRDNMPTTKDEINLLAKRLWKYSRQLTKLAETYVKHNKILI